MLGNLGSWWNGGAPGAATGQAGGLDTYAARMRAAQSNKPVQSPLVASYTPPAYQTTPPHVDINAVIAAMNAQKAAGQPQVPGTQAPALPMVPGSEGLGEIGSFDRADTRSGETVGMNADTGDRTAEQRGLAMGGPVTAANMAGPNPPGPDDGFVPLDKGEYVIKADAVKAVGKKPLEKINDGSEAMAEKVAARVGAKNDRPEPKKAKK